MLHMLKKSSDYIVATPLKIVAYFALVFAINVSIIAGLVQFVGYENEVAKYESWRVSEAPQKCESIKNKCRLGSVEVSPLAKFVPSESQSALSYFDEEKFNWCFFKNTDGLNCELKAPNSLQYSEIVGLFIVRFIFSVFVFFCVFYPIKLFCMIKHVGWIRLIISSAPFVSWLTTYYSLQGFLYDYKAREEELFVSIFLIYISLPFLIVHFYIWVRDGFNGDKKDVVSLRELFYTKFEIVENKITKNYHLNLLKICAVLYFVLFVLLMNI
jgi:hypothetical protein